MSEVEKLISAIKSLPGNKIVTVSDTGNQSQAFDFLEDGSIGHDPMHSFLFQKKVALCLEEGGGVIIRSFSDMKYESVGKDGKKIKIPYKHLYGAVLHEGKCHLLSKEDLRKFYPEELKEDDVVYRELAS